MYMRDLDSAYVQTTKQLKAYPVLKMECRIKILSVGDQEKLKKNSFMGCRIMILKQIRKTVRSSKNFICCFCWKFIHGMQDHDSEANKENPIWSQLLIILSYLVRVARRGTEIGLSMSNFYGNGGIYTSLSIEPLTSGAASTSQ